MSQPVQLRLWDESTSSAADSPARTLAWPDAARDWLASGADCGSSSIALLQTLSRDGLLSRTSPVCYPAIEDRILPPSFAGWSNAGMASPGGFWTLSISEWPSAAAVCSLSAILETDVPPRFYLSAKACRGILRRAAQRKRALPTPLREALSAVATGTTTAKRISHRAHARRWWWSRLQGGAGSASRAGTCGLRLPGGGF